MRIPLTCPFDFSRTLHSGLPLALLFKPCGKRKGLLSTLFAGDENLRRKPSALFHLFPFRLLMKRTPVLRFSLSIPVFTPGISGFPPCFSRFSQSFQQAWKILWKTLKKPVRYGFSLFTFSFSVFRLLGFLLTFAIVNCEFRCGKPVVFHSTVKKGACTWPMPILGTETSSQRA